MAGHPGLDHLVETLREARSLDELRSDFAAFLGDFGFSVFTYAGLRFPSRIVEKRPVLSNYPENWVSHYETAHYEGIDPILPAAARNLVPILWNDLLKRNDIDKLQRKIFEEAKAIGLCHGITIPVHGQMGDFAFVSVASDLKDAEFRKVVSTYLHDIHIASLYYHDAIRSTLTQPAHQDDNVRLANRERECLLWTARGKTAWETSEIMAISANTVNFYLKNAMKKLGVFNKNHAVVRAIMLYLIFP